MSNPFRLCVLTGGLAPYRVPLFNSLHTLCDLSVLFLYRTERVRGWDIDWRQCRFPFEVLNAPQFTIPRYGIVSSAGFQRVTRALGRIRPSALVVCGYESLGFWAGLLWARRTRTPVVLWLESTRASGNLSNSKLIAKAKRYFISRCDAYHVPGEGARELALSHGAPPELIVVSPNATDALWYSAAEAQGTRAVPAILYIGQLIPRKGLIETITALGGIKDRPWRLVIAGDGPLRTAVQEALRAQQIEDRTELAGYLQTPALARVMAQSDILVMPSLREVWGFVVNEALHAGLFVAGSRRVPAVTELVSPGINGLHFDPGSISEMRSALLTACGLHPFDRERIRATVAHVTPEAQAAGLLRSAQVAQQAEAWRNGAK